MRRVIVEHTLVAGSNQIWTGPNPSVVHAGLMYGQPTVWFEVDAIVPDLDDPVFRSWEITIDVIPTGLPIVRPYHRHVGSCVVDGQMVHLHLVTGEARSREVLEHRRDEAMRVLRRTAPGEALRMRVINRDRQRCRVCGNGLSFNVASSTIPSDRRATYLIVDLWDEVVDDNVVLACERCAVAKGLGTFTEAGLVLLDPPERPVWVPSPIDRRPGRKEAAAATRETTSSCEQVAG